MIETTTINELLTEGDAVSIAYDGGICSGTLSKITGSGVVVTYRDMVWIMRNGKIGEEFITKQCFIPNEEIQQFTKITV
jgi:hypothetical protein